jgi:hypothetical protein
MDTAMKATAPTVRSAISAGQAAADSEVAAMLEGQAASVAATAAPEQGDPGQVGGHRDQDHADSVYTMSAIIGGQQPSADRPGSRYRRVPDPASPAMELPATPATATGRKMGSTIASDVPQLEDALIDVHLQPRKSGSLQVEVRDEEGHPLSAFTLWCASFGGARSVPGGLAVPWGEWIQLDADHPRSSSRTSTRPEPEPVTESTTSSRDRRSAAISVTRTP